MKETTAKINKVILLLTISDVFSWGPLIIISSLSGIYLAQKLGNDAVEFVGIGTGIYYITRALFQIPVGTLTDKLKNDKDEIAILVMGTLLMGLPFTLYPSITQAYQYYILQFIFGLGVSLNVVNWRKLFALNVGKGSEGREYAFYDTILSLSTAIISIVIGLIANMGDTHFNIVLIGSGIIMMLASIWVLLITKVNGRKSRG
ncbi:MFS transporter [bacterium]|nr:MFS transporter [bacterium]